ncbi:hypothetical protein [Limisalsivibrio acetivorans]|uniref:hypothetical protein n=1 Tax=Limisalsivibrio acetivorans TaxID=1304888 RepID=UPI00138B1AD3|nr:hypothetical protein [Limisalsivibrio acetivorans]
MITDTSVNGGHMDAAAAVVSGVKFNLFPRVTSKERTDGILRYRKVFMSNRSTGSEPAYDAAVCISLPSNGGDRFYIKRSNHSETQADIIDSGWTGGGYINADVTAGDSSVQVLFESNDFDIPDGSLMLFRKEDDSIITARTTDDGNACATWIGNVATIRLAEQVPEDMPMDTTCAGICIELGNLQSAAENVIVTSASGGLSDGSIDVNNQGCIEESWTLTFTSATEFDVAGSRMGALPSGSISGTYSPLNPVGAEPLFMIQSSGWTGSWQAGDTLSFDTKEASAPVWIKEVVPAGTAREPENRFRLDWMID